MNQANRTQRMTPTPVVRKRSAFEIAVSARIEANKLIGLTTNPKKVRTSLRDELGKRPVKSMSIVKRDRLAAALAADTRPFVTWSASASY